MDQAHFVLIQRSDAALRLLSVERKPNQTYRKKLDPPTFMGDIIDYPDFFRKFKAQVGRVNLDVDF